MTEKQLYLSFHLTLEISLPLEQKKIVLVYPNPPHYPWHYLSGFYEKEIPMIGDSAIAPFLQSDFDSLIRTISEKTVNQVISMIRDPQPQE